MAEKVHVRQLAGQHALRAFKREPLVVGDYKQIALQQQEQHERRGEHEYGLKAQSHKWFIGQSGAWL